MGAHCRCANDLPNAMRMAVPDNEFWNDVDGMADIDGKLRLQHEELVMEKYNTKLPFQRDDNNKFDFDAGTIFAAFIGLAFLIGFALCLFFTLYGIVML